MGNNYLRGRIVERYRTVKCFAREIGWSNRKAYDIVNGRQEPTSRDIDEMCKALGVEVPEEIRLMFFVL